MNVIEAVTEVAKKYEGIINDASTEEHKLVMLPNGTALIIDAKKYKALFEEGIQLALPEQSSTQRKTFPIFKFLSSQAKNNRWTATAAIFTKNHGGLWQFRRNQSSGW